MARYLLITENANMHVLELNTLEELQEAVGGGYIEGVRPAPGSIVPEEFTVYANEDGLARSDMGVNMVASTFMRYRYLVGPVIIGGPEDGEGNTTDIPQWFIDKYLPLAPNHRPGQKDVELVS